MSKTLKFLHLEDNENDAMLVKETIAMNEIDCEIVHVDNKEDFLKEMKKNEWDVILADYNLPGFDGLEALKITKKTLPEIPFIFISGVLGEELAIETLKQGATDYILKARLERLVPAINRALKDAAEKEERIKLEREIAELEQMIGELRGTYDQLTRRVRGFIKIELPTGKYTLVDKFLEDLSGYKISDWKSKPFFIKEIIHPDFKEYYQENINQMKEGYVPKLLEYKIIRDDGDERWWLQFNIGAFDADGTLKSISAVLIDNTENKIAQLNYQNLFENALMGIYRSDIETGAIIEANNRLIEIFGYDSVEEFKQYKASDFYFDEKERKRLIKLLEENGFYEEVQILFKRKDNTLVWISESARIYPEEGYIEGVMLDISEAKKAQEELANREKELENIFEHSGSSMILVEENLIISKANNRLEQLLGIPKEEVEGKRKWTDFVHKDDMPQMVEYHNMRRIDETKAPKTYEFRIVDVHGNIKPSLLTVAMMPDSTQSIASILDISDKKQAEESLRKERKAFQIIAEASIDSKNISELCLKILKGLTEIIDFDAGTVRLYDKDDNLLYPIAITGVKDIDAKKLKPVSIFDESHAGARVARTKEAMFVSDVTKNESLKGIIPRIKKMQVRSNITYPILDSNEELLGVLQLVSSKPLNIQEEEKILFETIADLFTSAFIQFSARDALKESEEKFRTFAEQSLIGVLIFEKDFTIIFSNEEISRITDIETKYIIGQKITDILDGLLNEEERKKIHIKESKMRKTLEPYSYDVPFSSKKGKQKWVSVYVAPIIKDGKYDSTTVALLDITEEKRGQITIERERQAFNILAEATINAKDIPDLCQRILTGLTETLQFDIGTFRLYDKETGILNPIAIVMKDKSRISEIKQLTIDDKTYLNTYVARTKKPVFAPVVSKNETAMKFQKRLTKYNAKANITWPILDGENNLLGTVQIVSSEPKEFPEEDQFFFETIVRFFATALEQKWAEEALRLSEEKYRILVDTVPFAIIVFDLNADVQVVNKHTLTILGAKDESEVIGKNVMDLALEEEKGKIQKFIKELLKKGKLPTIELKGKKLDGSVFLSEITARIMKNQEGKPDSMIAVLQDVTEKKEIERERIRLTNIIEHSEEVVISAKPDGTIIFTNPAMEQVFGYSQKEIIGQKIDILTPSGVESKKQKEIFQKVMKDDKITLEANRLHKDGSLVPSLIKLTADKDNDGKIISVNALIIDISEIKELEQSLQAKYEEFELLNKIISAGYSANTLNQFLDFVLNTILDELGFSGGAIYLTKKNSNIATIRNSIGISKKLLNNINEVRKDSPQFKRLFLKGETVMLLDFQSLDPTHKTLDVKTIISVPFYSKGIIIGALTLLSKEKQKLNKEKISILEAIGKDVGTAIAKFLAEEELGKQ